MNMMSSTRTTKLTSEALRTCFILNQNGGDHQSTMDFDSSEDLSPPRRESASSAVALCSNAAFKGASDGPQQRPTMLGVVGTPSMVTKVRDNSAEVDDGSLPCTPDAQSDVDMDSQSGDEVLESDTRQHVVTFLRAHVGSSSSTQRWRQGKVQETMTRVVEDVLQKHQYAYNGMIIKLELDGRGDDMSFVTSVAKSLFADGTTNWGRIASLVAFGAAVCQYQKARGREHCVTLVSQEISTYLLSDQREWLVKNKSWEGFVEFFRVADPETTVRNTLMAFAGFAGIGATIALLIR